MSSRVQDKTPVSPNPTETPLEIPGFDAYLAIIGMIFIGMISIILIRTKRNR